MTLRPFASGPLPDVKPLEEAELLYRHMCPASGWTELCSRDPFIFFPAFCLDFTPPIL